MSGHPLLRWVRRALGARPGVSATVIAALGLGLAANAVLLAVLDAAVLRPFPFPEPDRLVGVGTAFPKLNRGLSFFEVLSGPEIVDLQRDSASLADVIGFDLNNEAVVVDDRPERVFTAFVWGDPIATLRVRPTLGRGFTDEEVSAAHPVAIVSHAFWTTVLGADPNVVGRGFRLQGERFEIVGVMPPRTRLYGTDLWVPAGERAAALPRNRRQFNALARLRPGVTAEQVASDLDRIARRTEREHAAAVPEYAQFSFGIRPWTDIDAWGLRNVAYLAVAASGLVLLLVAANLTSVLLARAAGRRREAAVRAALGASRRRLAASLFGESALQAAVGGVVGLALAAIAIDALPAVLPASLLPGDVEPVLNVRVALAVAVAAVVAACVIGLVPALQLARVAPGEALNEEGSRTAGARSTRRWHGLVVAGEVAVALVVLGAAAMLTVNTLRLLQVDRGFDTSRLTMMRVTLPVARYDGQRSLAFFDEVLARTRALPYVEQASASNQPPPGVFSRQPFDIAGQTPAPGANLPSAFYTTAASAYRETLGLRLVQGRWFDEAAPVTGAREVVINQALAARFFADRNPLGQRIRIRGAAGDNTFADVVGVAADIRNAGLSANPQPEIYGSVRQIPDRRRTQLYVLVRTRGEADPVVADVRGIVQSIDPEQPIYAITTVEAQYEGGVASRRAAMWLLGLFCVLAAALAGLGIFGVLSYAVSQRAREIAVRVALGGRRGQIVRLILGQAMRPVVIGLAVGVSALFAGQRIVSQWVFGATPEPLIVGAASLALLALGVMAALWPALKATAMK
jgi:putative ABC transport system permease protein